MNWITYCLPHLVLINLDRTANRGNWLPKRSLPTWPKKKKRKKNNKNKTKWMTDDWIDSPNTLCLRPECKPNKKKPNNCACTVWCCKFPSNLRQWNVKIQANKYQFVHWSYSYVYTFNLRFIYQSRKRWLRLRIRKKTFPAKIKNKEKKIK